MDFETVLTEYRRLMWKIINDFVRTHDIPFDHTDDIFQEACIRLHEKLATYDQSKSSMRTFVATATEIACMRYRREYFKSTHQPIDEMEIAMAEPSFDKMEQIIAEHDTTEFNRQIITLKMYGYTQREVAEKLGTSQSTVSRVLNDFRDTLLEEMRK